LKTGLLFLLSVETAFEYEVKVDPNGYIGEAFIQDSVTSALKKLENAIGYLLEDAKAAIQEVADEDIDPICTCKTLGRGVANG